MAAADERASMVDGAPRLGVSCMIEGGLRGVWSGTSQARIVVWDKVDFKVVYPAIWAA